MGKIHAGVIALVLGCLAFVGCRTLPDHALVAEQRRTIEGKGRVLDALRVNNDEMRDMLERLRCGLDDFRQWQIVMERFTVRLYEIVRKNGLLLEEDMPCLDD